MNDEGADDLPGAARVAVIVAHPDDETLWAGGLILSHPRWSTFIITLCRGKDVDRAPRFLKALDFLGAEGAMGDLDDGPEQVPLPPGSVRETLLSLLPMRSFDLLLTHAPQGEYTSHRRHGEVSRAAQALWRMGALRAPSLWTFAYEDGHGAHLPRPCGEASLQLPLPEAVWTRKHTLITEVYGFPETSWEARTTPRVEAFDCFRDLNWRSP